MTNEEVKKNIWQNSITSYLFMVLKLILGVLMFRMLYQGLTPEEFGFWSLLWSVFGYGILLDFGFGFTAEKRVAELSALGQWDRLARILSTVFFLYVGIGIAIILAVFVGSEWMVHWFRITAANRENFRIVLIYFFCGMGVTFPLGIFPEILIGQQRIALVNAIFALALLGNFIGLVLSIHFHWGFHVILVIGLLSGIIPSATCGVFALRRLPGVRIHPKLFSPGMVRETTRFSVFAYLITVSNIILGKTDQLVISTALAVSAIAIYQAGSKVGEMFGTFAQQLPSTFSPVAAHMHAKGDADFLRDLLVNGTRFSVMLATPPFLIGAFYMEGVLRLLTGSKTPEVETFWVGEVLLLWGYIIVVTQSVTKRIFVMCGHERRLTWLTAAEALLNLGLSLGLILYFKNVICVAVGSLVSTVIISGCFLWPWAAREAKMSGWRLAHIVLVPVWAACLPLLGFLIFGRLCPWFNFRTNTLLFIAESLVATGLAIAGLWFRALTAEERVELRARLERIFFTTAHE